MRSSSVALVYGSPMAAMRARSRRRGRMSSTSFLWSASPVTMTGSGAPGWRICESGRARGRTHTYEEQAAMRYSPFQAPVSRAHRTLTDHAGPHIVPPPFAVRFLLALVTRSRRCGPITGLVVQFVPMTRNSPGCEPQQKQVNGKEHQRKNQANQHHPPTHANMCWRSLYILTQK